MFRSMKSNETDVIMIRHAQSEWNRAGRFTGRADPQLTSVGRNEAQRAAETLAEVGYSFSHAYCSRLQRSRQTAEIILRQMGQRSVPIAEDWRLNKRHYGALQGKNKIEMAARVGEADHFAGHNETVATDMQLLNSRPSCRQTEKLRKSRSGTLSNQ